MTKVGGGEVRADAEGVVLGDAVARRHVRTFLLLV